MCAAPDAGALLLSLVFLVSTPQTIPHLFRLPPTHPVYWTSRTSHTHLHQYCEARTRGQHFPVRGPGMVPHPRRHGVRRKPGTSKKAWTLQSWVGRERSCAGHGLRKLNNNKASFFLFLGGIISSLCLPYHHSSRMISAARRGCHFGLYAALLHSSRMLHFPVLEALSCNSLKRRSTGAPILLICTACLSLSRFQSPIICIRTKGFTRVAKKCIYKVKLRNRESFVKGV